MLLCLPYLFALNVMNRLKLCSIPVYSHFYETLLTKAQTYNPHKDILAKKKTVKAFSLTYFNFFVLPFLSCLFRKDTT